ncbi:MAG: hypothetical protein WD046_07835 [Paracoccaceae bacterium]
MKTTLDASKLLGYRLVAGGGAHAVMDAKIGSKEGVSKTVSSTLIGAKDGEVKK